VGPLGGRLAGHGAPDDGWLVPTRLPGSPRPILGRVPLVAPAARVA